MGLSKMEDMGQMGNADEAILPDDVPFSMDDLELEDDPVEMQVGCFNKNRKTAGSGVAGQFTRLLHNLLRPQDTTPFSAA